MFNWSPEERLAMFIAGQEKLAREEAAYNASVAEQAERNALEAQREIENKSYDMGKPETAEQRLNRANLAMDIQFNEREVPLTLEERGGLSEADFLKLPPERRLAIAYTATDARKTGRR